MDTERGRGGQQDEPRRTDGGDYFEERRALRLPWVAIAPTDENFFPHEARHGPVRHFGDRTL
jgi:hypothetical protein